MKSEITVFKLNINPLLSCIKIYFNTEAQRHGDAEVSLQKRNAWRWQDRTRGLFRFSLFDTRFSRFSTDD